MADNESRLTDFSETDDNPTESKQQEKDLIWDQILLSVSTFGFTLSLIPVVVKVLADRSVACNSPVNFTATRDQLDYLVVWCSRHVRGLEELPLLILFQSLCLVAPHVTWRAYASPAFEEFFSVALQVGKLRMKTTGLYDEDTIRFVKHLWDRYRQTHSVQVSYRAKLLLQFFVCLVFLPVIIVLYDSRNLFSRDIFCSNTGGDRSLVNVTRGIPSWTVWCTHASALSFLSVWIADVCLLFLGASASIVGMHWLHTSHWTELDYQGRCDFYYCLGISYGHYSPSTTSHSQTKLQNDFNFLLMMLYCLDKGQGEVFRDLIVEFLLQERWKFDYENHLLFLYKINQSLMQPDGRTALNMAAVQEAFDSNFKRGCDVGGYDDLCSLGHHLLRLCTHGVKTVNREFENALLLFSGSRGFALAVSKLSRETFAVEFSQYYQPDVSMSSRESQEEQGEKILEQTFKNLTFFRVPNNITNTITPLSAEMFIKLRRGSSQSRSGLREFDLMVVSCLEPHFRSSTVRLTLENLFSQCTKHRCLIIFCSFSLDIINSILGHLKVYCDNAVLETNFSSSIDEISENEYIADFQRYGDKVRVYFQLIEFNLEKYWTKTQMV